MFLLTDLTNKYPRITKLNDTKDVGDVVTGITGDRGTGDLAETVAANMSFGNEFVCDDTFKLHCVMDDEVTTAVAEHIAAIAQPKMTQCLDDYAERIWAGIKDAVVCQLPHA